MNESKKQESNFYELILVLCEVVPQEDGTSKVRFGSKANEEALIQMCKEDPESWNLVKSVINDTITQIETAAKE